MPRFGVYGRQWMVARNYSPFVVGGGVLLQLLCLEGLQSLCGGEGCNMEGPFGIGG